MDPWEMFCKACKTVVEEQNVYLEVLIVGGIFLMHLEPMEDREDWEDEEDEQA